ncbi:CPK3 [Symbiodinium pilosum]|uniref:CPK3 protein n=1 Tax=Symbiodinium pilosum TaxID=2952 RepID=A0A812JA45_SYMPI|nr:CPK3 [Symbiodinium pilosum]
MDHPNIVRLYGVYEDQRHLYLVMELCQGGELFDHLSEVFALGEKGARICMRQVFASVAYCHSKGIVHRDLKPENYLLLDKNRPLEQTLLKLIDFGLAKNMPENGLLKSAVGTPYYVAPEVLAQAYTEAADTWSAGVMLYIMICGAPPFNAAKDSDILKLIKKGQYSMEGGVWPTVSDASKSLIKACLEMDHQKRITAQDALSHERQRFRQFSMANRFRKAALTAVACQLNEDEQKELREIFMRLDTNGDGYLSLEEMKHALQHQLDTADLEQVLKNVDSNGDGRIEYTEPSQRCQSSLLPPWINIFIAMRPIAGVAPNCFLRSLSLGTGASVGGFHEFGGGYENSSMRSLSQEDGDGKITYAELQQVLVDNELSSKAVAFQDAPG